MVSLRSMKEKVFGRLQRDLAESGEHLGDLKHDLDQRMTGFKAHRSKADQAHVACDFGNLLTAWGIEDEDQLPLVCHVLKLRLLLFALPIGILAILALWQDTGLMYLVLGICLLPCIFGLLSTFWRLAVLKRRRFVPFWSWLCLPLRSKGCATASNL